MKFIHDNFDLLFDEAGSVDAFKKLILEMAVRGKLVHQDHDDEPASSLIKNIIKERERFIKEGILKKEKLLPPIKEEEMPFDLPEGWQWFRLGDIVTLAGGNGFPLAIQGKKTGDYPFFKVGDLSRASTIYVEKAENWLDYSDVKKGFHVFPRGTIVFPKIGGALLTNNRKILGVESLIDNNCMGATPFLVDPSLLNYTFIFLKTVDMANYCSGTSVPSVSQSVLQKILFPLPPLKEQKRTVKKIDEIFEMIPQLEEAFEKRTRYNRQLNRTSLYRLTDAKSRDDFVSSMLFVTNNFDSLYENIENVKGLRQAILTLAVQGKLIPQDPNDEPASILLEKIQKEKGQLISEGKLKKENPLPPIKQDEVPFKLPDGWEWVRIGEITELSPRNTLDDDLEVAFVPMSLIKEGFANSHIFERRSWKEIKSGFTHFMEDDVVVAKITPCFENRKSAVMKNLPNYYGSGTTELHVFRPYGKLITPYFLLSIFKTDRFIQSGISTYTGTAGQQRIKKDFCRNFVVGIPPLKEQKNIVEITDRLMAFCDDLENNLIGLKDDYKLLLNAVLSEAISNAS